MNMEKLRVLWEKKGVSEKLFKKYCKQIENDCKWDQFELEADTVEDGENTRYKRIFLGTVLNIYPSGKYWTVWALDNVSAKEQLHDEAYGEAMEEVFERHGMCLESGEGDPCDLFAVWDFEDIEEEEEEDEEREE